MVFDQVIQHLDDNILQDPYHSTYRKGHGTETALLRVKSDIDQALSDGDEYVLLVPLDLSVAFDTIEHTILTNRLPSQCGIQGTANRLISSYLTGRTQRVRIGEEHSDVRGTLWDLSCLRSMYVQWETSPGNVESNSMVTLMMPSSIYFSPRDPQSLLNAIRTLEKCIDEVKKWMLANKLKVNYSKTEFIVFVSKHTQSFIHVKYLQFVQ